MSGKTKVNNICSLCQSKLIKEILDGDTWLVCSNYMCPQESRL